MNEKKLCNKVDYETSSDMESRLQWIRMESFVGNGLYQAKSM